MKTTKLILLLIPFAFFACKDNDNPQEPNENEITSTNYTYEGDLYRFYLQGEINALESQIETWEQTGPNDPGYDEAQTNILNAQEEISGYNETIENTNTSAIIVLPTPPTPPTPPVPCVCFDLFDDLNKIITDNNLLEFSATISNENEEIIYSTNQNPPTLIEDFEVELLSFEFTANNNSASPVNTLTINKTFAPDNVVNYSIPVRINAPQ